MQVYPNRFESEIAGSLKPCYMLFGDEPHQKLSMLQSVRRHAREQGFDERTVLVADKDFSWSQLIEATQTLSLFSTAQIIELELPTGKPGTEGSKVLQDIAPTLGQDVLLVIHGPKIGKDVQRAKWFKVLDDIGVFSLAYPLEGKHLDTWLNQTLKAFSLSADADVIQLIAEFTEGNMLAAYQEIEKLALVYQGQHVDRHQVEAIIVDQSRFNVFQLVDVMLSGDQQRCVKMLYRLESEGIEPTIVLWALAREWQLLWKLKQMLNRHETIQWQRHGIWRNRQAGYQAALSRLSMTSLAALRDQLRDADIAFKQNQVVRPYVKLCHLTLLFMGMPATLSLGV
ncbi:DNA polymerase III subunit delta [Salinimonas sp. HHU 13199]|uniref:DNA polymerase III subunit delta n=1 Tax=Salinimonas profundi TaxID=2729140 RepID=A0ABR8LFZ0_9ALTE|nr:DNA polymerase III subunit delta [Salinimonas profundi]MBD3584647.1 DNA polymerase III subunit delta [Salinimonas profundi]